MKALIDGEKETMLTKDVLFVNVPRFDELKPENVIKHMDLEMKDPKIWKLLLNYCPEIKYNRKPKDRTFFYNILNTILPKCIDKFVYNALKKRE